MLKNRLGYFSIKLLRNKHNENISLSCKQSLEPDGTSIQYIPY
jgi:type IV secretory pathway VirD2 relaxase